MNADRLLALYDRVAEAPDAVARLRRFVLDLAVRGKLVEQDPADEPASELLKQIAAEKARLVKAGAIRKPRGVVPLDSDACPFSLPRAWECTQIAHLGAISPRNEAPNGHEASFVSMPMIPAKYGATNAHEARPWGEIKKGYTHFAEGDVGLAKITPCFENGKSTVFRNLTGGIGSGTTELHIIRPLFLDADYIVLFLKSPHFIGAGIPRMTGTAGQKRVPTEYFTSSPFPLPPLAEQRRIVAKVDELMALCDQLEGSRNEREETRDRLTVASFARLNASDTDVETIRAHARFAVEALPALTARADQVGHLRQTILNLAVRGRLVEHDPADEPASELLKRIAAEHRELVQRKELRKKKTFEPITGDQEPFPIPHTWEWCRLGNLFHLVTDGAHHTPKYIDQGVPFLSVKDVSSGSISFRDVRFISEEQHRDLCKRCRPERGDILLTKVGTTGIAVPINTNREFSIFVSVALLKFSQKNLSQDFLCHLINSPFVKQQSSENTQGIGNQNLVLKLINAFTLPVPPLAEQHRIVDRVDKLMALCDQLEMGLSTATTTRCNLLSSLLHEALEHTRYAPQSEP